MKLQMGSILGWALIALGFSFGLVFLCCALKNLRRGYYRPFSLKRFLFQRAASVSLRTESPLLLLLYALLNFAGSALLYILLTKG